MKFKQLITSLGLLLLSASPVYAQITNPALERAASPGAGGEGLAYYIAQIWRAIVIAGGVAFLVYFLLGGLEWITAGGDSAKIDSARQKITGGLIGLALLVTSYAIVNLIGAFLGIDLLSIDWTFSS